MLYRELIVWGVSLIVNLSLCEDYPVIFLFRDCFSHLLRGLGLRGRLRLFAWRGVQYLLPREVENTLLEKVENTCVLGDVENTCDLEMWRILVTWRDKTLKRGA